MGRNEIIRILSTFKNEYADEWGILALGVFGSVARGEADESSDVDVVVRLKRSDLFLLAGIKIELEERLKLPVDLVTYRDAMNQFLKSRIDREALYV